MKNMLTVKEVNSAVMVEVTFRRYGRSGRVWVARFQCGAHSTEEILRQAWNTNSEVLSVRGIA